jgi:hypothetical protein
MDENYSIEDKETCKYETLFPTVLGENNEGKLENTGEVSHKESCSSR